MQENEELRKKSIPERNPLMPEPSIATINQEKAILAFEKAVCWPNFSFIQGY